MILIAGLGNPGARYIKTRHNVGFMLVDKLASKATWKESKSGQLLYCWLNNRIELIKPQTFMGNSGKSLAYAIKKHSNLEKKNIFVVYDDLDIPFGKYKIQFAKSPKQHNGLLSIYEKISFKDFWHIRIGIDNRKKDNKLPPKAYVLQKFSKEELAIINSTIKEVITNLKDNFNAF